MSTTINLPNDLRSGQTFTVSGHSSYTNHEYTINFRNSDADVTLATKDITTDGSGDWSTTLTIPTITTPTEFYISVLSFFIDGSKTFTAYPTGYVPPTPTPTPEPVNFNAIIFGIGLLVALAGGAYYFIFTPDGKRELKKLY